MELAGKTAADIVQRTLAASKPSGQALFLNVNFPGGVPNGIRATKLGVRIYREGVDVRTDPRGREYYWMGGPNEISHPPVEGSDTEATDSGYVSVTPLRLEMTQNDHLALAAFVSERGEP